MIFVASLRISVYTESRFYLLCCFFLIYFLFLFLFSEFWEYLVCFIHPWLGFFSVLVLIFCSGSFDRICTSFSSTFHFHLFSPCGLLFFTEAMSDQLQHQRQSLLFSPVPTGNTFSTGSPHIWRLPVHLLWFLRSSSHPALVNCSSYQRLECQRFYCFVMQRSVPRVSRLFKIRDREVNIVDFVGHTVVSSVLTVQKQL